MRDATYAIYGEETSSVHFLSAQPYSTSTSKANTVRSSEDTICIFRYPKFASVSGGYVAMGGSGSRYGGVARLA
jgi:hypothetical protein